MIERQQAEQLAAVWQDGTPNASDSRAPPVVEEFDPGYLITTQAAPEARALPGDLPTTVIDKQTGELSTWPRLPFPAVEQMYRQRRPAEPPAPRAVDPAAQLLRELSREGLIDGRQGKGVYVTDALPQS
ncbi:hypothetical protein [Micromonospora globispora]|uniref:hypothetical protein n=1 Tax=Micromonospora globispora TaxID=1450148 RepID=UPI001FAF75AB|nr:hypothetical protein [Micromonospora globispora]